MKDFKETINSYSKKDLKERKSWYSSAANNYSKVRPCYPQELIHRVIEITNLSAESTVLEVGCGPGTATISFAEFGCSMLCLEPNSDFYKLAQQDCQSYPNVKIQNTTFEEWIPGLDKFDAVLAATSFHWIPQDIAYLKASNSLKENGYLVLLWNMILEPAYEVCQVLQEVYQIHAPSLGIYEGRKTQEKHLQDLGKIIIDSGQFKDLMSEHFVCNVTYTVDDYLTLLSTYSQYIQLESQARAFLFEGLRDKINNNFGSNIELSYLSAFHIGKKY